MDNDFYNDFLRKMAAVSVEVCKGLSAWHY